MLHRWQILHSVNTILAHCLINSASTFPSLLIISHMVIRILATGAYVGSLSLDRYHWQALAQSPQWIQVLSTAFILEERPPITAFTTFSIFSGVSFFTVSSRPTSGFGSLIYSLNSLLTIFS